MADGHAAPGAAMQATATLDLEPIKARQQKAWASGNFSVIGTTLQIVGESLCEAVDLRSGERVLDVAAGNGNCAIAAARRWAEVTAVDFVPALLEHAAQRAAADHLSFETRVGDAHALPFADGQFDVVLSSYGVMFAADQAQAARELTRVCRSGGRIGLANWTPEGFIGQLFKTIGRHVPPPAGLQSPARWGTAAGLTELFGDRAADIAIARRDFVFRYRSPAHWVEVFRQWYGPVLKAFEALPPVGQAQLEADLLALIARFNRSGDSTMVVPGEYLEVVIRRA